MGVQTVKSSDLALLARDGAPWISRANSGVVQCTRANLCAQVEVTSQSMRGHRARKNTLNISYCLIL